MGKMEMGMNMDGIVWNSMENYVIYNFALCIFPYLPFWSIILFMCR